MSKKQTEDLTRKIMNQAEEKEKVNQFFTFKDGKVTGVKDYLIYEHIKEENHICIIGGVPFIYNNGAYERDDTGANLKGLITKCLLPYKEVIKSTIQNRIYNLFLNDPELQFKMDQMNNYPRHQIVFRNMIYDPIKKRTLAHSPEYRAINRVNANFDYEYALGELTDEELKNSNIYKWLTSMFPAADDLEMVLEFCGYCLTTDTRQQKFLIELGLPGSGKSLLIKLIGDIVGPDNTSSLPLEKLSHRFSSFNLLGKLVNSCGDISTTTISDTTTIKQALGEDYLQAEAKGKDAISFKQYAKFLFSANGLPTVSGEDSSGFYRRLLVANVEHNVDRVDPAFYEKVIAPDKEIFIYMIVRALERMYQRGTILESKGSRETVNKMWERSDPVKMFLDECTAISVGRRVERKALYDAFNTYRFFIQGEQLSPHQFYASLEAKGYKTNLKSNGNYFVADIELLSVPSGNQNAPKIRYVSGR